MPVVRDINLNLDMQEVLRRQGVAGRNSIPPKIQDVTGEMLAVLERRRLLEAAFVCEILPIAGIEENRIVLEGGRGLNGPALPAFFPEAGELAAVVCTIGPGLEKQVGDFSKRGEPLRGLLLDGIGTAAVDGVVHEALKFVAATAVARGLKTSSPVNPGMPGFPLTAQPDVLELARADEIGVSLSPSGMLLPRKSVTMVMGIGLKMPELTQAEVCARCGMRETCSYRKFD